MKVTKEWVYDELNRIFQDTLMRNSIKMTPNLNVWDILDWDDFKQINFIMDIEMKFGIQFSSKDLNEFHTISTIVGLILARIA